MSRLPSFDPQASEAIARAESDPDQAAEALRIAAGYLRRREVVPDNVADWLADAIDCAMHKPEAHRARALALELGLAALNWRPAADWLDVGKFMDDMIDAGANQTTAARQAAVEFNIVEATAVTYYKKYLAAWEAARAID